MNCKLTKNSKALIISIMLLLFAVVIAWALQPYYVDAYFDRQPVQQISDLWEKKIPFGQVIVLEGDINVVHPDDSNYKGFAFFTLMEKIKNSDGRVIDGRIATVRITDKLNCIPSEGTHKKIAGAWNPISVPEAFYNSQRTPAAFYGVWIIGGC